jgi:two-component system sensor histidine kinase KdpD
VALTFLLATLLVSTVAGTGISVFMSVLAALSFDWFFLPPVGYITVADPQNYVALFAFLIVALIASNLSARARREAQDATQRRREAERLYSFSQRLLSEGDVVRLLNAIPRYIVDAFEIGGSALFNVETGETYRSTPGISGLDMEQLKVAATREEPLIDRERGLYFASVRLGVRSIGSIGILGPPLSQQTLEALATLVGIAIERARAIEQLSKTEVARESERIRSALLDSVTHDFRTPLTSIKTSVTGLLFNEDATAEERRELLTIINEESDRLNRLIEEAAEMSRLEAGDIQLDLRPQDAGSLVEAALDHCKNRLGERQVKVQLNQNLPLVRADLSAAKEVLIHLIENADQYSPRTEPITIRAEATGNFIQITVADRGPGIDELEQGLIFNKFYRGKDQRYLVQGTGMGLPIAKALVDAQGGAISLTSQLGHGSVFMVSLPIDHSASERK